MRMELYFRNLRRAVIVLVVSLIVIMGSLGSDEGPAVEAAHLENMESAGEPGELFVWVGHGISVRWWRDEQNDRYVLFLPGAADKRLELTFPGAGNIYIDDRKIENGEKYHFTEGRHLLQFGGPGDGSVYDFEVMYTSDIASLFLETESGTLDDIHASKGHLESGRIQVLDGRGYKYYEGDIEEIHCRGNSSFENTDKKSYTIKLSRKAGFFGMGAAKKWILVANAFDDTLLRNTTAFSIARMLQLSYTPGVRYVDVYANGMYIGNYLLCEKVEIGKDRVEIRNLERETEALNGGQAPDNMEFFMEQQGRLFSTKGYRTEREAKDISGGYLLELETSDRYGLEASGFLTSRMQPVVFASPKYASYDQVSYIADMYQDFEDAVFSDNGCSPYTGAVYSDYIDMDSFARKYLLEELVKNLDASFTSQYIYKYDDSVSSKFFAGPCWDYDKSIAASGITGDGIDLHDPEGLYAAVQKKDSDIWYALYQHEDFRRRVTEIFFADLAPQLREHADDILYLNKDLISKSNKCNMIRWNTFPQLETYEQKQEMYGRKVDELAEFIEKRLDFLAREWGS